MARNTEPFATRNYFPALQRNVTATRGGQRVVSYINDLGSSVPIVMLLHGYPQSAFSWRHVIPLLLGEVSLFVPELPGYGVSDPPSDSSRVETCRLLMAALRDAFGVTDKETREVILAGHDRGARIVHRVAVDQHDYPFINIKGTIMLDIVPTKVQWDHFGDLAMCKSYYHWPFLANAELAIKMLKAYGGGNFVRDTHGRNLSSPINRERLYSDDAVEVYATLLDTDEAIRTTCKDYEFGAQPEYEEQQRHQEMGNRIQVPTMVMFSKAFIGSRIDVEKEWRAWIDPGVAFEAVAIENGVGHFLQEEAFEDVSSNILRFTKSA